MAFSLYLAVISALYDLSSFSLLANNLATRSLLSKILDRVNPTLPIGMFLVNMLLCWQISLSLISCSSNFLRRAGFLVSLENKTVSANNPSL